MRDLAVIAATILAAAVALPAGAQDGPTPDDLDMINAILIDMQCQMSEWNIEKDAFGFFVLNNVLCAGGRYYIELDEDFGVVEVRKE